MKTILNIVFSFHDGMPELYIWSVICSQSIKITQVLCSHKLNPFAYVTYKL